jgi:hypothetical protein
MSFPDPTVDALSLPSPNQILASVAPSRGGQTEIREHTIGNNDHDMDMDMDMDMHDHSDHH